MSQVFGEHICGIFTTFNVVQLHFIIQHYIMDKMVPDVDVLDVLFCNGIQSHKNGSLVIPTDRNGLFFVFKFVKQSPDPDSLVAAIWEYHMFSFYARQSDRLLYMQ